MFSERNWFWPHPLSSSPNSYIYIQQQTNFPGAHVSLESKLGDIFGRRTLLFPSLTIYFFQSVSFKKSERSNGKHCHIPRKAEKEDREREGCPKKIYH
jgi:hypothetical protein